MKTTYHIPQISIIRHLAYLSLMFLASVSVGQEDFQKTFQRQFIEAGDYSIIELPAGTYQLPASLWLDDKKNVTIRGKGMDKTILNFAGQISGAEGIKITNSTNITLEDLTVQDTKGDGVKIQEVDGITLRNVKAEWTRGAHKKNGGYGLYPVQCKNVIIEACKAIGASDAGIYVGQSNYIIVRNCHAYQNVTGIEIENSFYADVFENEANDNTAGILVFDLPDLIQKKGGYVRVFNNHVHHNNHINFAPKGNIVAKVPQGTGIMILATNHVEVFENKILHHKTIGTAIVSYYITENPINDTTYYPYPSQISVYHNHYEREQERATMRGRIGKLYRFKLRFGRDVPHIVYDGIVDKDSPAEICIRENMNQTFANIDAENGFKNISRDAAPYNCTLMPIPPVEMKLNH
jgi:parallel beta-helix repeat protein